MSLLLTDGTSKLLLSGGVDTLALVGEGVDPIGENKRRAAPNMPLFVIHPIPDGTIGIGDRTQAYGIYPGLIEEVVDYAHFVHTAIEVMRDSERDIAIAHAGVEIIHGPYGQNVAIAHAGVEILRSARAAAKSSSFFLVLR